MSSNRWAPGSYIFFVNVRVFGREFLFGNMFLKVKAHVNEAKNGKDSPKRTLRTKLHGSENSKTKQIEPCQSVI